MAHLAVVRGLTYTNCSQVFKRWLMPTYRTSFRWTSNRADSEDATAWALLNMPNHLQLPELVQVVDESVLDLALEAVTHHWVERYGIPPLEVFRRYLATYAIEQARCLYSPALIDNLERNWDARRRSLA
jgi:hypothetical protein